MVVFLIEFILLGFLFSYFFFHMLLLFPRPIPRPYKILNPTDIIEVHRESLTVAEFCNEFKPIIRQSTSLRGPKPKDLWYEVIDTDNNQFVDIFFRVRWMNENHPNFFFDILYQLFRKFYFGSHEDLEYVLIRIDRTTGKNINIKFETDRSLNPDHFFPEHIVANLSCINNSDHQYKVIIDDVLNTKCILNFKDNHPIIEVLTWNHVFVHEYRSKTFNEFDLPIKFVTEKDYKKYRFDRRSWVDYGSIINKKLPLQRAFTITTILLLVLILVTLFL